MNIVLGAVSIVGFQPNNIGADVALAGVTVTLDDDQVTGSSIFPQRVVGMGGFKISLATPAVTYDVESIESRSALTLTTDYTATTGTVTGTLHKYVELRIYALQSFTPSGSSEVVQQGAPHSSAWFRRYGASIINDGEQNVLHVPQIVLPATTDSSNPTARYFAGFYSQSGAFIQAFPTSSGNFRLSHSTTPTSWAQIITFNSPANAAPPEPTNFYTAAQIDARFPSGLADQMLYFAATGNVLTALTLGPDLQITAGVLEFAGPGGVNRIQEEGANLPQQTTLNFVGSSFTAADDPGNNRTNVTADPDLNALASTATTGLYNRTGSGTSNTITTSAGLAGVITDETGSGALVFGTAPTITGGTHTAITGLGVRSTGSGAFDLTLANTENLTAGRTLTLTLNDAARTINLGGNLTTAGAFITSGANSLTLTTTGATSVTLPTTGTLATLAGTETFTNKTLTSPRIGTAINDTNGNELLKVTATGSAVNDVTLANAATGSGPTISATGDDTNIPLNLSTKGTGNFVLNTNSIPRVTVAGADANLYLGDGVTSATPDNYVINATGGSGTDIAGAHLGLAGGKGTGNAVPGHAAVRYPLIGASGTTLQSLSTDFFPVVTSMFTTTGFASSIANTTTETSLLGVSGSAGSTKTIEAGSSRAGTAYPVRIEGIYGATGAPTGRIRVKLGSTLITDTTAFTVPAVATGLFTIDLTITTNGTGATATVSCIVVKAEFVPGLSGILTPSAAYAGSFTTVDLTANKDIEVTWQWGTADAANTITTRNVKITRER